MSPQKYFEISLFEFSPSDDIVDGIFKLTVGLLIDGAIEILSILKNIFFIVI